ncbi:MAG: hypothetical protein ACOYXN_07115 [Acidobacteriota bacterium]
MKRWTGLVFLALLLACSRSLSPAEAQGLVRDYLAPFHVEQLTFANMTQTSLPGGGEAYVVVANFVVPYKPGETLKPMPNQTFYLTFNELSHRYEVNRQLTGVAQGIQGMIDLRKTADFMKDHPYDPTPWKKR